MEKLSDLPVGHKAAVIDAAIDGPFGRRLREIGLCPGAELRCVGASPLGDPRAYEIYGAVFALRQCDAVLIKIR